MEYLDRAFLRDSEETCILQWRDIEADQTFSNYSYFCFFFSGEIRIKLLQMIYLDPRRSHRGSWKTDDSKLLLLYPWTYWR